MQLTYIDDIAVWFYALRTLLKRPDENPWDTPSTLLKYFPPPPVPSTSSAPPPHSSNNNCSHLIVGVGRTKGRRNYMEDFDFQYPSVVIHPKNNQFVSLYGVLDGHGGVDCGQYISDEFASKLLLELKTKRPTAEALFAVYVKLDLEFMQVASDSQAGCTATVLVWDGFNGIGVIGNAGDTRGVLSRAGIACDLTRDKKASDPYEIARIYREGGFVSNGRVMGSLAVARALGDCSLKHTPKRILIPDPEVTTFKQQTEDEFIVIATDGLWDVMSSQDVVNYVHDQLSVRHVIPGK